MFDKCTATIGADVREKLFEVATNARKVRFNRLGIDVAALESDVVTESFRGGVNGDVMQLAKSEIRVCRRSVCICSGVVNHHSKKDGVLINKAIHCPRQPNRLPGHMGDTNHFFTTPNAS